MNPYPFDAKLKLNDEVIKVKILSVSHNGLVIDSLNHPLLVNKTYDVEFFLPIVEETALVQVVVSRIYVDVKGKKSEGRVHMNEVIYKELPDKYKKQLVHFLANLSTHKKP